MSKRVGERQRASQERRCCHKGSHGKELHESGEPGGMERSERVCVKQRIHIPFSLRGTFIQSDGLFCDKVLMNSKKA